MSQEYKLVQLYLRSLQVAALRSIPDACAHYGVDASFAAQIGDLSIPDLEKLCTPGVVLFRPVMPCDRLLKVLQVADQRKREILARLAIPVDTTTRTTAAGPPILAKKRRAGDVR